MVKKPYPHEDMVEREALIDLLIHDLRSPLAVISASAKGLLLNREKEGGLTDKQLSALERIRRNTAKAQGLLQEIIEISCSREGLFRKEPFLIEKVIVESILDVIETTSPDIGEMLFQTQNTQVIRDLLKTHGVFIEVTGKYTQSLFPHDPKKIRQVLRNLIGNAFKFRRQRVSITADGEKDLILSVEDDGPGIPPGKQNAIFERFVQLDGQIRPDVSGHGLGLTGVKALVSAMKGEITLVSSEETGTRFTVRIPPLP